MTMRQCTDKLILETILQDKFSYFKAEEGGVAVATATDDNAEIRNLDARLFEKSTCWHTRWIYANKYNRNTEKAKEKRKIKWEKSKLQNVVELRD